MRPAISDLQAGEGVPPETVAGEARAWHAGFESIRAKLDALKTPRRLDEARRLFDESIVRYLASAKAFEAAADGPMHQREAGIKAGIAEAREGARLYNEASLVLQAARKEVGLPPTDDFPNHKAGRADLEEDG